jgi:chemotaxis family two-component system sensor kinase Cph1
LHNINMIQPHGYLIVVDIQSLNIIQVSENCAELMDIAAPDLINTSIDIYISDIEAMVGKLSNGILDKVPFYVKLKPKPQHEFLALSHVKGTNLLIELFATTGQRVSFVDVFQSLKLGFGEIVLTKTVEDLGNQVVLLLKRISGFERVLMYKFDDEWNGKVIAECKAEDQQSYLGQQFPASDIPKQARAMYARNAYRLIPHREYTPVKLYPVINPISNSFIDLSDCSIRSVAPVHIEYLKNMDVMASMSIRILYDDKLWGLISFHDRTPKYLSFEDCSLFELLSGYISNHLNFILNKEKFDFKSTLERKNIAIQKRLFETNILADSLFNTEGSVMDLFSAHGAALILNGKLTTFGQVPPEEFIENLAFWLQNRHPIPVFADKNLPSLFEEAAAFDGVASGILALSLDKSGSDYLIMFRPETEATIDWGGNPNEAVQFEEDGQAYHPRNSFRLYKEVIKQTSKEWHVEELNIAQDLRNFLFEYIVKQGN